MAKASKRPAKKAFAPKLPDSLSAKRKGDIAILRLSRPQKRNALNDGMILGIEAFFQALPKDVKAVVIHAGRAHRTDQVCKRGHVARKARKNSQQRTA